MAHATCSIASCDNPSRKRGWCCSHYERWKAYGDPLGQPVPRPSQPRKTCSEDGCDKVAFGHGWCIKHYTRWRRNGDPSRYRGKPQNTCLVADCNEAFDVSGLCARHWEQQLRDRLPRKVRALPRVPSEEVWMPIPGYERAYEVSSLGRVRSVDRTIVCNNGVRYPYRGRLMKPTSLPSGHLSVDLSRGGDRQRILVHRLVLTAFVGPCPPGMEGCHNDGDPTNNSPGNLRWDYHQSNMHDKRRHGTDHQANKTHCPRGHLLKAPNIKASAARLGRRSCLTCDRTLANQGYALKQGYVFDFDAVAARHYAKIMGVEIDDRIPSERRLEV